MLLLFSYNKMVEYCKCPNAVNDIVDALIMSRNTVKTEATGNEAWSTLCDPYFKDDVELTWDATIDANGHGVTGDKATDRWAEEKPIQEYVHRRGEAGLAEPLTGRYRRAQTDSQVPPNKVGEYLSRTANLEQLLKQVLFDDIHGLNPEAVAWIEFLAERGYDDGSEITKIGTENMRAEARIWYDSIITVNKYLGRIAEGHAEELGINDYKGRLAYKISTMLHEMGHNRGVDSEHELGALLSEFYEGMAEKSAGTDKERIYRALAKESAEYAKSHSFWNRFVKYWSINRPISEKELHSLIREYEAEGAEKGYRGKELRDYVNRRLQDDEDGDADSDENDESRDKSAKKSSKDERNDKDSDDENPDNPGEAGDQDEPEDTSDGQDAGEESGSE